MVERKFDWITTKYFDRQMAVLDLDEYEMQVCITSIERFCASTDRHKYNPSKIKEKIYYEILIPLFSSTLRASVEVERIDAILYSIEKV